MGNLKHFRVEPAMAAQLNERRAKDFCQIFMRIVAWSPVQKMSCLISFSHKKLCKPRDMRYWDSSPACCTVHSTPHQTPHVVLLCWEREVREVIGSVTLCHLMTDHPAATLYFTSLLFLPTSPSSTSVNAVVQCQCSARDLVVVMNNYSFIWHNLYFKH